jgi:hypothetical protein
VEADTPLVVRHDGVTYPAAGLARGAAFELFSSDAGPGWLPNTHPGAHWAYRRFTAAAEVEVVSGTAERPEDEPLLAPVNRTMSWEVLHRLSQSPSTAEDSVIVRVRRTAGVRRGTRMVRFLGRGGLADHLAGALPNGFCYRESDVAHLRTPGDLAVLGGDGSDAAAVFALRWRAIDPLDYEIPTGPAFAGLVGMPTHARTGPPIIGTGFAPTARNLIPEFVTADLADLPLPAGAALVAYTTDGTEVPLFSYLPEQRAWIRMCGAQWRHLLTGAGVPADQEYFMVTPGTRLVGTYRGEVYEAVADPPAEFRVAARNRAARFPVDHLARRTLRATWRGAEFTVARVEGDWLRLRLCRPDAEQVTRTGVQCVERGRYEVWTGRANVTEVREVDVTYPDVPAAAAAERR